MTDEQREKAAQWYEAEAARVAKHSVTAAGKLLKMAIALRENDPRAVALAEMFGVEDD